MNHRKLINLAHLLGYKDIDTSGLCNGFSNMWIQAAANGGLVAFNNRLTLLNEYSDIPIALSHEIKRINNLYKAENSGNKDANVIEQGLTEREKVISSIPAFFEGILLYQKPDKYQELFNEFLSQREASKISEFTSPIDSPAKLSQSKTVVNQYNNNELSTHLRFLAEQLSGKPDLAINFKSSKHSVAARYSGNGNFEFIDTNFDTNAAASLTARTVTINELIESLRKSFKYTTADNSELLMSTQIIGVNAEQIAFPVSNEKITQLNADQAGTNLLNFAITNTDKATVDRIDFDQVDLNKADGSGVSNLTLSLQAIAENKSDDANAIFEKLINHPSIDVNPKDSNIAFPISRAINFSDWERAKKMIEHPSFNPKAADKEGITYLHSAVFNNDIESLNMARLLIEKGADINAKEFAGTTLLMFACAKGDINKVKLLLEHQANVNDIDKGGYSALTYACATGNKEIVELLLKNDAQINGTNALNASIVRKYSEISDLLLNHPQININEPDSMGQISLHLASLSGDAKLTAQLLEKDPSGANLKSKNGKTPLDLACELQAKDIIPLLLPHTRLTLENIQSPMLKAMELCPRQTQKDFLIKGLEAYIEAREKEEGFIADTMSLFGFVYSKRDKILAASDLLDKIKNSSSDKINPETAKILQNGRLGELYNFYLTQKLDLPQTNHDQKEFKKVMTEIRHSATAEEIKEERSFNFK